MLSTTSPRSLAELRVAVTMATISLKALPHDSPLREEAKQRLRRSNEALRTFIYKAHTGLSPSGKLIRY